MAGFKTHVTTSSLLGVGYAGVGIATGYPIESSIVAGGLCGVAGMLPDIDSDSGVPLRETMGLAAAVVPMLLLDRFQQLGFTYEQLVLSAGGIYLFIRFGISKLLAKYTVHRGMFHSIPAALTFAGLAFLICGCNDLYLRYFKAGAVLLGVMSHLVLDEIYAVEWSHGRWRFKKSFGTALKLWGKNSWANFSAWGKLVFVALLILGEPMVMDRYGEITPLAIHHDRWNQQGQAKIMAENRPNHGYEPFPVDGNNFPGSSPPAAETVPTDRTIYDTARRLWKRLRE